jgi:hypothetical protein
MPGDDLVRDPQYVTNRAVTVQARPDQVWPWVAQMGEWPRGGFYSYVWLERLQGMDVEDEENLLPDFQDPRPGEALDGGGNLIVKAVAPGEYLILGPPPQPGFECSWCLALFPTLDGRTRLVSRVRARARRTLRHAPLRAVIGPGQFLMERKMLLGIRRRAEARARAAELAADVEQAAPRGRRAAVTG